MSTRVLSSPSVTTRWLPCLALLAVAALPAHGQDHLFAHYWRIDATGTPYAAPRVIDLRQAGGFSPQLRFTVLGSAVPWNTVSFTDASPLPLWTGGLPTATSGTPGCSQYADSSSCLSLGDAQVGVYPINASNGGAVGAAVLVVGGGSPLPLKGPQAFTLGGTSNGSSYQYGLSLGDTFPLMLTGSLPNGADATGIAAAMATSLNGLPGFSATATGPELSIDTLPPGRPFRFWIDDFQVTGGGGSFNPDIDDTTIRARPVDHQPGLNFSTALQAFGQGNSERLDVGDVDRDGDLDVVVANGGDAMPQANRIYINLGSLQGGTQGTFADGTATHFGGVPDDTSRHIELADFDGDFDLDIQVSNRGKPTNGGEPSRSYRNQGGIQGGLVGFFTEDTNSTWGNLISVPAGDQVLGGNQGPFRDYSCDCEFGDLDLDGDLDLFHSSYGPNISGTRDSRVFLNDGTGTFDELWPWADAGADTMLHTLDIDLIDLDADFDLDVVASSRDGLARIYRNDLSSAAGGFPGAPFTDITQTALIDTGAAQASYTNYEAEVGDVDGDGDFDLWMVNYASFSERILRNDGGLAFSRQDSWIKGDNLADEQDTEFVDFDGDGDLDAFVANFGGHNELYLSSLLDDVAPATSGLYHRTGTSSGGSLATWPETLSTGNGNSGTTLGVSSGDLDGDGDPDLLLANDGNQDNRYWENVLGIPDSHAPSFALLTIQGDKADGSDTVLRCQLRDNSPSHAIDRYQVDLLYTVDSGPANRIAMTSQGGQGFQATLPGGVHGTIRYWIEAHDQARNMALSAPVTYAQTASGTTLLRVEGQGTPGVFRRPRLDVAGTLLGSSPITATLRDAAPSAPAVWFFSAASTPLPFKGGLLHTVPVLLTINLPTNAGGQLHVSATWPAGLPAGLDLWVQFGVADAAAAGGASLSNAVRLTTP